MIVKMIYPTAPHHFLFYLCLITYYWEAILQHHLVHTR